MTHRTVPVLTNDTRILEVCPAGSGTTTSNPPVIRVLKGRDRTESERFTTLRSHYLFTELRHA
jgi:hypothetical protein